MSNVIETSKKTETTKSPAPSTPDTSTPVPSTKSTATPFIAQFPIATGTFVHTLLPHIGQNTPRGKFAPPTAATQKNISAFLNALNQYDISQTPELVTTLNNLMKALDISAIRLQEMSDDAVIFYPNPTKNKTTPLTTGLVMTWRVGLTQETGNPATANNPIPQFFIFDPHSGQDGTYNVVTQQFLAGAKALLSNAFNPNVAPNPNWKHNPIGPNNIKRYADPSHSNTTAFVPFGTTLYTIYPKAACTVTHGMVGQRNFQITANNDFNGQFLKNGKVSFTTLLTIALGVTELPSGTNPSMPTNPAIIAIRSAIPGYIVKNGVKAPLSSAKNKNAPIRTGGMVDNTDTVGHMANGTKNVFDRGTQTDHAFLVEFGGKIRGNNAHYMKVFIAAQQNATKWYGLYDPDIHDPWQLAKRFPDVYNNMLLYPNLFDPAFIKEYKLNGTNPYNTSSSVAAVQDFEAKAAQDELDMNNDTQAEDVTTDLSDNDILPTDEADDSDPVVDVPDTTPVAASKPLTFSSAATNISSTKGFPISDPSQGADKENKPQANRVTLRI